MKEYIIIGNGIAGITAAQQLRQQDSTSPIHIFSDEVYPFYARIRLPQIISAQVNPQDLFLHPQEWYEQQNIQLHLSEPVLEIDADNQRVITKKNTYPYHKLLLASGSHSFTPPIPGADQEGVFTLRTMDDALKIAEFAHDADTAILVGGGLLGLEAGYALVKAGLNVKVLEMFPRLLPRQTDNPAAAILQKQLENVGFEFYLGVKIKSILGDKGKASGIELEDGRKLQGQLVLISAGVRSNLELAKSAGVETNLGVVVDNNLRTSNPNIFAAGDVAEHNGRSYGIWPAAEEQGAIAGANMAGANEFYAGTLMNNRLKVVGVDLVAAGELDAEGKYKSEVVEAGQAYRKLVFDENNLLIGCLLLGDIKGYKYYLDAIKFKKRLDKYEL